MAARDVDVPQNLREFQLALRWRRYVAAWEFLRENDIDPNEEYSSGIDVVVPLFQTLKHLGYRDNWGEDEERARLLLIERFLELGADPNIEVSGRGDTTTTPLGNAVHGYDVAAVELMLRYGGDPLKEYTRFGGKTETVMDLAIRGAEVSQASYNRSVKLVEEATPYDDIDYLEEVLALNLARNTVGQRILEMLREKTESFTKSARKTAAMFTTQQIREALDRFDGDHQAAARFLAGRRR